MRLTTSTVALGIVIALSAATAGGEDNGEYREMVGDKEYRISPGEKPGTWLVEYGDDKLLWEPKPHMDDELAKEGPKFYLRWAKAGLPYPWERSVEERVQLARTKPGELLDRYHAGTIFFAFGKSFANVAAIPLISADGFERRKVLQEWGQSYVPQEHNWENLSAGDRGVISRKYLYVYREPNEVRGLGGRTVNFVSGDRRPDEWLYAPATRKVRRLSSAASADYLPGTIFHFDQVSHVQALPDIEYRLARIELYKGLGDDVHGFDLAAAGKTFQWPDGRVQKVLDGVGALVFVVEAKPKPGVSWWYGTLLRRYGVHFSHIYADEAFDPNGKKIQTMAFWAIPAPPELRETRPYYIHYGQCFGHELTTGFKNNCVQEEILWDPPFPAWLFNTDTLNREPAELVIW